MKSVVALFTQIRLRIAHKSILKIPLNNYMYMSYCPFIYKWMLMPIKDISKRLDNLNNKDEQLPVPSCQKSSVEVINSVWMILNSEKKCFHNHTQNTRYVSKQFINSLNDQNNGKVAPEHWPKRTLFQNNFAQFLLTDL
jgi:hypothetical protein